MAVGSADRLADDGVYRHVGRKRHRDVRFLGLIGAFLRGVQVSRANRGIGGFDRDVVGERLDPPLRGHIPAQSAQQYEQYDGCHRGGRHGNADPFQQSMHVRSL